MWFIIKKHILFINWIINGIGWDIWPLQLVDNSKTCYEEVVSSSNFDKSKHILNQELTYMRCVKDGQNKLLLWFLYNY